MTHQVPSKYYVTITDAPGHQKHDYMNVSGNNRMSSWLEKQKYHVKENIFDLFPLPRCTRG